MVGRERPGRGRARHRRRIGRTGRVVGAVVVVLLLAAALSIMRGAPERQEGSPRVVSLTPERTAPAVLAKNTYLVVGVEPTENNVLVAKGLLQFVYDPAKRSISGVTIGANTFAEVPGRGFEPIGEGYAGGIDTLSAAVKNLLGVAPRHYLVIDADRFETITGNERPAQFFDAYQDSDMPPKLARAVARQLGDVSANRISLVTLPVKPIAFGQAVYSDLKAEETARIVKAFWGIRREKALSAKRVIVLNGNGAPGIARIAADRLIAKNYRIIDAKNADNFDHQVTDVIFYRERDRRVAQKVRRALGVGRIVKKTLSQDVTDVVVILGNDFSQR